MALPGKRNLRKAINEHGGLIADVARHFEKSRQTIYNWIDHYNMWNEIDKSRQSMRTVARDVIYQRLMSKHDGDAFEAAKFVMLHLQDDGELIPISPETVRLLTRMGLSMSDVVREFNEVVRLKAMQEEDIDGLSDRTIP
jgi:uncharacterized LabA/DUF88 family protein